MTENKHADALAAAGIEIIKDIDSLYVIRHNGKKVGSLYRPAATDFWRVDFMANEIDTEYVNREDAERVAHRLITGHEIDQ